MTPRPLWAACAGAPSPAGQSSSPAQVEFPVFQFLPVTSGPATWPQPLIPPFRHFIYPYIYIYIYIYNVIYIHLCSSPCYSPSSCSISSQEMLHLLTILTALNTPPRQELHLCSRGAQNWTWHSRAVEGAGSAPVSPCQCSS